MSSGPWTEDPSTPEASFWVARALAELLAFGAHDQDTAGQLLRLWKWRNRLSAGDRVVVLDWFRNNPVEPHTVDQHDGGWASGACADSPDDDNERSLIGPPINIGTTGTNGL